MNIYTKTGDKGTTSLMGGRRVSKCCAQVEIYGTMDELNSHIGLLTAYPCHSAQETAFLKQVQDRLFRIGGFYSFDFAQGKPFAYPFIEAQDVCDLERAIDQMNVALPPLKNFILPGGTLAAAQAHVARTVCRRCERQMAAFADIPSCEAEKEALAKAYINRLSDFLFVKARHIDITNKNIEQ